jgi:hypothetical protein
MSCGRVQTKIRTVAGSCAGLQHVEHPRQRVGIDPPPHPQQRPTDDYLEHADLGLGRRCDLRVTSTNAGAAAPSFDFHHVSVRGLIRAFAAYVLHVSPLVAHAATCARQRSCVAALIGPTSFATPPPARAGSVA